MEKWVRIETVRHEHQVKQEHRLVIWRYLRYCFSGLLFFYVFYIYCYFCNVDERHFLQL